VGVVGGQSGITRIVLPQPRFEDVVAETGGIRTWSSYLRRAYRQVRAFLHGRRSRITFPIDLSNLPPFWRFALQECGRVSRGTTISYGELAVRMGRPNAARAVGQAMAGNPLPIGVPCHRVVGADRTLTGFGAGLDVKRRLLELEGHQIAPEGESRQEASRLTLRSRVG
jgi:methylated-DNA-[protein]-cysteine S-methyltransferase